MTYDYFHFLGVQRLAFGARSAFRDRRQPGNWLTCWPVGSLMNVGGMVALPLAIQLSQQVFGTSEAPLFIS